MFYNYLQTEENQKELLIDWPISLCALVNCYNKWVPDLSEIIKQMFVLFRSKPKKVFLIR